MRMQKSLQKVEMIIFVLTTISSERLVLCEFETLCKIASTVFSQIKCTGSSSMVECNGRMIGGGEKGSGDGGCVKIAAVQEEVTRPGTDTWLGLRGVCHR
ncbi:uncharacterized protein MONOS_14137 [Monocercomonoides exilis]|uniref:uncharacterized protein n=1 Tax=Monocercomonoides exilis TaxID=2049356 RepID=UPI0035595425|nr:hypothetical protein MONOS_14137 [Monocercomonoides exilis]|eukprot:MONOS_14137.1-p1 / transcript=MONOS_14137.1 / gene=MONOS_14137 / organism=Monocercomonoides_exilis_PA203 / gene_product=unspecified product / transcript_product=unspecified product / location=Mono_scaffold00944:18326-18625(+) / protein_length=100 / sequence_SO=supercontig / SO=protein_coding / is_pseudo=false